MIERQRKIYLCRPSGEILTQLNGVHTDDVEYDVHVKDYNQITFTVDQFIAVNGTQIKSNGYDELGVYMNVLLEGLDMFQIQQPKIVNDGIKEVKEIVGYSCEKEFEDKDWVGLKVNTGEKDSLEYLIDGNVDEATGFAKEYITIYNPNDTRFSLLHYILTKMPGWSVDDEDIDRRIWNTKVSISEENTNLYALLMSIIAPKAECLFLFDTINRKIKAVSKKSLDDYSRDTNIFISFRNLANEVGIEVDEDSVFTVFSCYGDNDLDIRTANYNDDQIYDLSYFMSEPWMSQDLIDKITVWNKWRDDNRSDFIAITKSAAKINADIFELNYRVPNDADEFTQWDNMETELLQKNRKLFEEQLTALQVSVDPDPQYDSDGQYIPWVDGSGNVDHERYQQELKENRAGYYTYIEILNYVIPNIDVAIRNKGKVEDEKEKYIRDYETNWELYGLIESQAKEESYQQRVDTLKEQYAKEWEDLTPEEQAKWTTKENYDIYHNEYKKLMGWLGTPTTPGSIRYHIAQLKEELADKETALDECNTHISEYAENAEITNPQWGLTEEEIITFFTLCHHTDYTNNNLFTTSIDTAVTTVDHALELLYDAQSKLSEASQPQMTFQISLDNFLNIPEFSRWKQDFELLNFMRVGIRDDYSVKLRLTGYKTNPCELDPLLELEFSNFITSRSGRSDLTELLDTESNRGSKNSITIGTGNSNDDREYMTTMLQMMIKSGLFQSAVGGIATGIITTGAVTAGSAVIGTATVDYAVLENLVSGIIDAKEINVGKITGDKAQFNELFSKYINSEYIVTEILDATEIQTQQLSTKLVDAEKIVATLLQAQQADVERLQAKLITSDKIIAGIVNVEDPDDFSLLADSAFISYLNSGVIDAGTIHGDQIIAGLVELQDADDFSLLADSAFMDYLESSLIVASEIRVDDLKAKLATIDVAEIEQLYAENAFVESLQALSSTAATSVINDAYIYNAVANKIAVADLAAGDITLSNSMRILSENGKMIMNGTALQILGEDSKGDPYVGVQLGYATNGQPSLILRNEEGSVIVDPTGITADAVADGLIVNNMIHDGAISESKLGFSVMKTGDTVSIEQIHTGDGSFGAEWTDFKQGTSSALDGLRQDIEDNVNYVVYIETPDGTNIWGGNIQLRAKLLRNNVDVTDDYDQSCFIWTRSSRDHEEDAYWNSNHAGGSKIITVTPNDVKINADFQCKFEYNK